MQFSHTKFVSSRYRDLHESELRGIIHTGKILRNRETQRLRPLARPLP